LCTCTRAPSSFHSKRGSAEGAQRLRHVARGLREHRRNRLHRRKRIAAQARGALRHGGVRNACNAVRDHGRLAHHRGRQRRRFGDRIDHQRFEGALAQFAGQQPIEEVTLDRRGAVEQIAEQLRSLRPGTRSRQVGKRVERGVDVADRQRGRLRCSSVRGVAQKRMTDAAASLACLAGQPRHRDAHFQRRDLSQRLREQRDLCVAARRLGDAARCRDHVGEERHRCVMEDKRACTSSPARLAASAAFLRD
jgi:hypothetical protein